ncbi:AAA family ATPase [[Actinomadura] parvosata]|uniref:AAA family ATPase n=1 Tax=[Actinomadura] parvosata TaxID=1955412 RepID=UPI00300251B3
MDTARRSVGSRARRSVGSRARRSVAGRGGGGRPRGRWAGDGGRGWAEQRFRLFEEVRELLAVGGEPGGLLVVLDDLQWADEASLRLLVHLARGMGGARLAVLAIYRDTEAGQPLRRALASLAGEASVTRMRLDGLAEAEVGDLLAGVTGWPAPGSVISAVRRRTRGNPFFVTELARLLGGEQGDAAELPEGIRDAVRGRLGRLSAWCGRVVSAAAVLGSTVDPPALAAAAGWELTRVLDALDEAVAAGILTGPAAIGAFTAPGPAGAFTGPGATGVFAGPGPAGAFTGPGATGVFAGPGPAGAFTGPGASGPFTGPGPAGVFIGPAGSGASGAPVGPAGSGASGAPVGSASSASSREAVEGAVGQVGAAGGAGVRPVRAAGGPAGR